ncbi:hypothetical protein [uncultured Flavobacterium sp.]|uniref:hypothetical protein n=1 Tax=uncultured Flavobacterium sp. TaxID=165435 RepID=UPI0030EE5622
MKLESLKETKFKDAVLEREQMFTLNGGLTDTSASGQACGSNNVYPYQTVIFNYSWDSIRDGVQYFHGKSNMRTMSSQDCYDLTHP